MRQGGKELEREEVTIEAPSECPEYGGKEFRKIEDDISEVLAVHMDSTKQKKATYFIQIEEYEK